MLVAFYGGNKDYYVVLYYILLEHPDHFCTVYPNSNLH